MVLYKNSAFIFCLLISSSIFITPSSVLAQQSYAYQNPNKDFNEAKLAFDQNKYLLAQKYFEKIVDKKEASTLHLSEARFYLAMCASKLDQQQTEYLLTQFIASENVNPHLNEAQYELALFYYRTKKYRNAVRSLILVDVFNFSKEKKEEYYFKLGYSYFYLNDYEEAALSFFRIKDSKSSYAAAANYYYAHIAYQNGNYQTSLNAFLAIRDQPEYASTVPIYIIKIYFLQSKYQELIAFALPKSDKLEGESGIEITKMIGESYYRLNQYSNSIPFLQKYIEESKKATRDDYFELGFAAYQSKRYELATKNLEQTLNLDDALAQNAYYIIADCFLQLDKKPNARNAFRLAARMDYDKDIQESTLFDYAKLSYELAIQSDAVDAFQRYKRLFPNSYRTDLANQYLAGIFLTTKNYKDALAAMDEIKNKNEQIQSAYQRSAYFRGLEIFNDVKYPFAIELFDRALKYPTDPGITALANYWKAEALYNMKNYDEAKQSYSEFLYSPQASNLSLFNLANYNIAYCYFNRDDYSNAIPWFRKYLMNEEVSYSAHDKARYNDALIRTADIYFVKREFASATENYSAAIRNKAASRDYAWFQKGMIFGLQQKPNEKIECMKLVNDSFPNSTFFDDALYETANTYLGMGDNEKALSLFNRVMLSYSKSSYYPKAMIGIALIQYNAKNDDEAMSLYKKVVNDFPGTPEARTALLGIKNIYVGQGSSKEFLDYIAHVPFADLSKSSEDSITYEAAEVNYMKGDCEKSTDAFGRYLDKFPNGFFALNANFYKAECDFRSTRLDRAASGYEKVLESPRSTFTETSYLRVATIYYRLKEYEKALKKYEALGAMAELKSNIVESNTGKMRCSFELAQYKNAISAATELTKTEKVTNELLSEAKLIIGSSALKPEVNDTALARSSLIGIISESSSRGAEAKYLIGTILYSQKRYKESQDIIFSLVNQIPSYDDWIARGFILLADNYLALGDSFQAKATLSSVIGNYDGNDKSIIPKAVDKLNGILDREKPEPESMKLPEPVIEQDSLIQEISIPEKE